MEAATIGENNPFTVELYNRFGTLLPTSGEKLQVQIKGPYPTSPVDVNVSDDGKRFNVGYNPKGNKIILTNSIKFLQLISFPLTFFLF